jgi:ubiquinone biosynthesis protein
LSFKAFQHFTHIPRYREVANVFVKHGFGFIVDRISPGVIKKARRKKQGINGLSAARQLRAALEELGPTYIKLGQLLSTRPDLLSADFIKELEKLQNEVPSLSYEVIRSVCINEGIDIDKDFKSFNPIPIAAASIAQVHVAELNDGQKVAVKIQRPGIHQQIITDLEILMEIACVLERKTEWGQLYRISEIVDELRKAILDEIDFSKEARNADVFYRNFCHEKHIVIPKVFWEYSTRRVLTLEYLEGIKISDPVGLKRAGYDSIKIATNLIDALFKQVYKYGFFHADPHPGNIAVKDGEKIVFYDFGQVGVIDQVTREKAMNLLIGMIKYDVNAVTIALLDIGIGLKLINQAEFRRDVSRLQHKYYGLPLSKINIGEALAELIELSLKYHIRIPAELALLAKMLMTVENMVSQLDPQLSIVDIAEPYGRKIIKQKYSVPSIKQSIRNILFDYSTIAGTLPQDVKNILRMVETGEIKLQIEHSNLNKLVSRIDILSNRLAIAIIIASIIIGTSLVVEESNNNIINRFPIVEAGFIIALLLGLGLIYSIIKSGRY